MKYALPLLIFIALGTFSFSARAANDDLLNATLGQAIGQFMSQAKQPSNGASSVARPSIRGRMLHAKKLKGQQPAVPVVAAPVAPAAPASASAPAATTTFTRPMNALPAIAPAAGTPAATTTSVTHTQKTLPYNVSTPSGATGTGGTSR